MTAKKPAAKKAAATPKPRLARVQLVITTSDGVKRTYRSQATEEEALRLWDACKESYDARRR